jgi:hypothetical protein
VILLSGVNQLFLVRFAVESTTGEPGSLHFLKALMGAVRSATYQQSPLFINISGD